MTVLADVLAVEPDLPGIRFDQAQHRLDQLGLSVALDAGHGQDFPCSGLERDVLHDQVSAWVDDGDVPGLEDGFADVCGRLVDPQLHRPPDHHLGECGLARARLRGADDLAPTDHADPVTDGLHFAELVGDEDDRRALLLELAHDAHELVDLLRGQHRRRFVENQHLRVVGERLEDLDPLLDADGEILDEGIGVDGQVVATGQLTYQRGGGGTVEHAHARVCSRPSMTFSATVNTGTSMKCWWTIPIPAAMASPGVLNVTGSSSSTISPSDGSRSPYSMFISVDLPAPFSPSRQ